MCNLTNVQIICCNHSYRKVSLFSIVIRLEDISEQNKRTKALHRKVKNHHLENLTLKNLGRLTELI